MKSIKKVTAILAVLGCSVMSVGFTFPTTNPPTVNLCIDDVGGETDGNPMTKTNCGKSARVLSPEERQRIEEDRVSVNRVSEMSGEYEYYGEGSDEN